MAEICLSFEDKVRSKETCTDHGWTWKPHIQLWVYDHDESEQCWSYLPATPCHPADKSLFKSLKAHWEEACRKRVASCGGCRLPKKKFFMLFTSVWQSCTTVEICQSGFRATGMFPVNGRCIPEVAYAPSLTTERVQSEPLTFVSQWSTTAAVGEPSVSVSGPAAAVGEPSVLGPAGTPSSSDTLTATHNVWRSRQWWTTSVCLTS